MKIYLVTSEWQINGDHAWDNYAFAKKEDAEKFIEGDKNDVLLDIENGEYGNSIEDYTITKDSITSFDNEEWFQWSIEELEVMTNLEMRFMEPSMSNLRDIRDLLEKILITQNQILKHLENENSSNHTV